MERSVKKLKEKSAWVSKVDPDDLWDLCGQ